MKHVVIAPFQGRYQFGSRGIKEFPTEKVILLTPFEHLAKARASQKEFARFKIPVEIVELESENISRKYSKKSATSRKRKRERTS